VAVVDTRLIFAGFVGRSFSAGKKGEGSHDLHSYVTHPEKIAIRGFFFV